MMNVPMLTYLNVMIELISLPGRHTSVGSVHPVASVVLFAQQDQDSSMESASHSSPPFAPSKDFVLVRSLVPPPCSPQVPEASFVQSPHSLQEVQPQSTIKELRFNYG